MLFSTAFEYRAVPNETRESLAAVAAKQRARLFQGFAVLVGACLAVVATYTCRPRTSSLWAQWFFPKVSSEVLVGRYDQRCELFGCEDRYDDARACQCNAACEASQSCCFDYTSICAANSTTSAVVVMPASVLTPSGGSSDGGERSGVTSGGHAVDVGGSAASTSRSSSTSQALPSLFCFAVVRTWGNERELIVVQQANGIGIFACEEHAIFSNGGALRIGGTQAVEVAAQGAHRGDMSVAGTATSSWLNAQVFMKAWTLIAQGGKWWNHDWTLKADPDAVVFPGRLRVQLARHTPHGEAVPLYVANCDRTWHGNAPTLKLFGALEVLSRDSVGTYKAFSQRCRSELPWHGWGEDLFMQSCLNMLGAKPVNGTHMIGDKRCYPAPCSDATKVAYHDFKTVGAFMTCWAESRREEGALAYVK